MDLEIGSTVASVNGTATELEAAPEILNNTTMVPVRFVSEALGAVVQWEAANRVVRIHT